MKPKPGTSARGVATRFEKLATTEEDLPTAALRWLSAAGARAEAKDHREAEHNYRRAAGVADRLADEQSVLAEQIEKQS